MYKESLFARIFSCAIVDVISEIMVPIPKGVEHLIVKGNITNGKVPAGQNITFRFV